MRLWQDTHKDYENRKNICNWLLSGLRLAAVRPSRHPGSAPFLCQMQTDIKQYCNIITHAESTEPSPLAASIHSGKVFSLPLFPTILCYFLGKSADYGSVGKTELILKTEQPLQWKNRMVLVAAVRTRLQGEPWGPRESSKDWDFVTAPTSEHFKW